jgi:hypothetical protein
MQGAITVEHLAAGDGRQAAVLQVQVRFDAILAREARLVQR